MPFPLPFAGDTVSQLLSLVVVHPQVVATVIEMVPLPPGLDTDVGVGDSVYGHVDPADWMTRKLCPPTVTVPLLDAIEVFGATV